MSEQVLKNLSISLYQTAKQINNGFNGCRATQKSGASWVGDRMEKKKICRKKRKGILEKRSSGAVANCRKERESTYMVLYTIRRCIAFCMHIQQDGKAAESPRFTREKGQKKVFLKKAEKISKKVLTFFLVYPIIQNVPRMRQTKQRKTTNQAPLAQLVEQQTLNLFVQGSNP